MAKAKKIESKKIKTSVTLSEDVYSMLEQLAEKDSRSLSSTVEVLIKEAAAKEKIKPAK